MAILLDDPLWPAHGTTFAHLVSDHSLAELHRFAASLALPVRAFDLDHYDIPAHLVSAAVAAGARQVSRRDLVVALTRSGVRVPGTRRDAMDAQRRADDLSRRWRRLRRRLSEQYHLDEATWQEIGAALRAAWNEPHRHYHNAAHLHAVLDRLDRLTGDHPDPFTPAQPVERRVEQSRDGQVPVTVALAAWYHDAVHQGRTPHDEQASAQYAQRDLSAAELPAQLVEETAALVASTAYTTSAAAAAGGGQIAGQAALLHDADLGILATSPRVYRDYTRAVRREYAHVPEEDFQRGRAQVLRALLARPTLFSTPIGVAWWEDAARANMRQELRQLQL